MENRTQISAEMTVGELVRTIPGAAKLFEESGLDYCCGGRKALAEACQEQALPVDEIVASLEAIDAASRTGSPERDWNRATLAELLDHIVERHHTVVRNETPRLAGLIAKMVTVHGERRPEFIDVQRDVLDLQAELSAHLEKEERILFPFIRSLESALQGAELPGACFGTVGSPIFVMEQEHENAGRLLAQIQGRLEDRSGCGTCQEFFRSMDAFEADLHQHIHLENNVLFPRALELEQRLSGGLG